MEIPIIPPIKPSKVFSPTNTVILIHVLHYFPAREVDPGAMANGGVPRNINPRVLDETISAAWGRVI
jgi:hypothetical protein